MLIDKVKDGKQAQPKPAGSTGKKQSYLPALANQKV